MSKKPKSFVPPAREETPAAPAPPMPEKPRKGYKILQHLKYERQILEPGTFHLLPALAEEAIASLKERGVIE